MDTLTFLNFKSLFVQCDVFSLKYGCASFSSKCKISSAKCEHTYVYMERERGCGAFTRFAEVLFLNQEDNLFCVTFVKFYLC